MYCGADRRIFLPRSSIHVYCLKSTIMQIWQYANEAQSTDLWQGPDMSGQVVGVQNSDTAPYSRFTCSKNAMAATKTKDNQRPIRASLNEPINGRFHPAEYGRLICIHRVIICAHSWREPDLTFTFKTHSRSLNAAPLGGSARPTDEIHEKSLKNSFNLEIIWKSFKGDLGDEGNLMWIN